jgi:hypothetical protein
MSKAKEKPAAKLPVKAAAKKKGVPTKTTKKAKPNLPAKAAKPPKSAVKVALPANPVGRPTKYDPKFPQQMLDYFEKSIKAYTVERIPNGEGREKIEVLPAEFPTFQEFAAINCRVSTETIHEWRDAKNPDGTKKHPEFSEAYTRARDMQAAILTKGSMVGAYEGRFAGLAAKNLIGWSEKIEATNEVKFTMTQEEKANLDAIYANALKSAHAGRKTTALD